MSTDGKNRQSLLTSLKVNMNRFWANKFGRIFVLVCVVIIVVFIGRDLWIKHKHQKALGFYNQAASLTGKGNYQGAIDQQIQAYNTENRLSVKANYAYNIGLNYFANKNAELAKKWTDIAIDLYTKAGDTAAANNVKQTQQSFLQLPSSDAKSQADQNAKNRENVQDSNL
jgi:hypothetical protein